MPMNPRLLRPIASGVHPEAAAWRTAVVANGGSVSASTMKAVSTFCAAIDAAGIRDRFYRLNLFCGNSLNAALVPLYRGPSRTGTQYGNATDTNVGPFVSADYSESVGLDGDGTSKYLNTGLNISSLPSDPHIGIWLDTATYGGSSRSLGGADNFGSGSTIFWNIFLTATTGGYVRNAASLTNGPAWAVTAGENHVLMTGNGDYELYVNGAAGNTGTGTAFTPAALPAYIFATRRSSAAADIFSGVISHYSLGDDMTATQAANFYAALAAFQTTLGRA